MREVRQGQFYRHFKDRLYQIVAVAEHSATGERMVVYQALYGDYRVYVRPYEMFVSEVDREKYPEVTQKYRFELVEPTEKEQTVRAESGLQKSDSEQAASKQNKAEKPETEPAAQASPTAGKTPSEDGGVHPLLLEFLDAETLEEKLHIMIFGRNQMDDNLLNNIAISLDLVVDEKSTQEKYDEILNCLSMMEKFECNRLR